KFHEAEVELLVHAPATVHAPPPEEVMYAGPVPPTVRPPLSVTVDVPAMRCTVVEPPDLATPSAPTVMLLFCVSKIVVPFRLETSRVFVTVSAPPRRNVTVAFSSSAAPAPILSGPPYVQAVATTVLLVALSYITPTETVEVPWQVNGVVPPAVP